METESQELMESVARLSKDLREAARTMSDQEARYLVDGYYIVQDNRIRVDGQIRAMEGEPSLLLDWLSIQSRVLESQIKNSLDVYSQNHPIGAWLHSVVGIGPVLAAGYLAFIDIEKAPTAGHIMTFAGLDPTDEWHGKTVIKTVLSDIHGKTSGEVTNEEIIELANRLGMNSERVFRRVGDDRKFDAVVKRLSRRPWNATFKVVCWKTGESFVKTANRDGAVYGKLYQQRKALEIERNEAGMFADQAKMILKKKNFNRSTDAYKAYSEGKLPPAHIHARAKRWAVKIFISNLHEVWYEHHYGKPAPAPYPLAHLGHVHKIEP